MRLAELEHAVDFTLPVPLILHRVQRLKSRRGTVIVGPLRLAPRGTLSGRFDLPDDEVGYFAESGETAVYEALARREVTTLSLDIIAKRALLALQTTEPLLLLDLRFHAAAWPVLNSIPTWHGCHRRDRKTTGPTHHGRYQPVVKSIPPRHGQC